MEDPLRVLVSVDTKNAAASIEVRGALTGSNCETLLNILRHTATLGANICINLTRAARIEAAALEIIRNAARAVEQDRPAGPALQVGVQLPAEGSEGPAPARPAAAPPDWEPGQPLDNETALDMILQRDPAVFRRPAARPRLARPAGAP